MSIESSIDISTAGMRVQSARLKVIAQNVANANTTGQTPGADPYRRKTITFDNHLDKAAGVETVRVARVGVDQGDLPSHYDPSHPAADARGYVKDPNVDTNLEMMDMREAQEGYTANVSVIETTRAMLQRAIDSLRG